MIVTRWAEFTTSLPDDGIEDETGFIQWPGKNVAEALSEILIGLGCTGVEIFGLEHAGYDVGFRLGKRASSVRVTVIDNPLIAFEQKRQPEYLDFLKRVSDALASDGRFEKVRWFTDDEVLTGVEGAMSPLAELPNRHGPLANAQERAPLTVRPWVKFTTDLPDDGVPAENGTGFLQHPGRSATLAMSEMLARCGCKTIRPRHSPYLGWEIYFRAGKHRLAARVHLVGRYQVKLSQESWLARTFGLVRPEYVEVLRRFSVELAKDLRFHDIRWFSEHEIYSDAEGALSPVEDAS